MHTLLTLYCSSIVFFFNDTATTEIYTLSLHDALPIYALFSLALEITRTWTASLSPITWITTPQKRVAVAPKCAHASRGYQKDRKSTRLNSSHANISYAVFCLKKKKDRYLF